MKTKEERFEFIIIESAISIALMAENEKEAWIKLLAFLENAHGLDSSDIDIQ